MRKSVIAVLLVAPALAAGAVLAQTGPRQAEPAAVDLATENERLRAEVEKYRSAYAQISDSSLRLQSERDRAQATLSGRDAVVAACQAKNIRLVVVAGQILDLYQRKGLGQVLAQDEPLIGLKRVELEKLAQDYGDAIYEGRFDPRVDLTPTPAAEPPGTAAPVEPAPPPAPAAPPPS